MSFHLVLVTKPPYSGRTSHEIIEAIMSLALFDVAHKIVFFDAGLSWLTVNQCPEQQKSLEKQLNALPIYGCDDIYYCSEHRATLLESTELNSIAEPVLEAELAQWFQQAKQVEVF